MIRLDHVYGNFERRAQHFLLLLSEVSAIGRVGLLGTDRRDKDLVAAYICIELQTGIGYVARSAFLAGMVGGYTASGHRIPRSSSATQHQALKQAARIVGGDEGQVPGRGEPAWHSTVHLTRVVTQLQPSNEADLIASTGVSPKARIAVKAVRDFYAHRAKNSRLNIIDILRREYGERMQHHPSIELFNLTQWNRSCFLERWIWNYLDIAEVLCRR